MALVVGLLQIGALAWSIQGRASILRDGREVLLRVEPVDPRDLLRGDYVRLGYEAARVPISLFTDPATAPSTLNGKSFFVRLARQADGYFMPVAVFMEKSGDPGPDQVDIKAIAGGETTSPDGSRVLMVDYGIERFYVPEGEGLAIQNDMRVRPFSILAAVDASGAVQIKSLMDGDKMLYAEPLY